MHNIIDLVKRFIVETRNNNIAADRNWDEQRQQVYVRFNNFYSNNSVRRKLTTLENPETE